jgi:hypothetical protein
LLFCPVCNGLQSLIAECPQCQSLAADYGRWSDYLGPYSPYRSIDEEDTQVTNGTHHICVHVLSCPSCTYTFTKELAQLPGS